MSVAGDVVKTLQARLTEIEQKLDPLGFGTPPQPATQLVFVLSAVSPTRGGARSTGRVGQPLDAAGGFAPVRNRYAATAATVAGRPTS